MVSSLFYTRRHLIHSNTFLIILLFLLFFCIITISRFIFPSYSNTHKCSSQYLVWKIDVIFSRFSTQIIYICCLISLVIVSLPFINFTLQRPWVFSSSIRILLFFLSFIFFHSLSVSSFYHFIFSSFSWLTIIPFFLNFLFLLNCSFFYKFISYFYYRIHSL